MSVLPCGDDDQSLIHKYLVKRSHYFHFKYFQDECRIRVFDIFVDSDVSRAAWLVDRNCDPVCMARKQRSVDGANKCVAAEVAADFYVTKQNLKIGKRKCDMSLTFKQF